MLSGDVNAESGIELTAGVQANAALKVTELSDAVLAGTRVAPDLAAGFLLLLLVYDAYSLPESLSGLA